MTRGGLVLELSPGPPVAAWSDCSPGKDGEAVRRSIEEALDVDLEMRTGLEVAAEGTPLEGGGLPVPVSEDGAGLTGDDVPAGDGEQEIQLADPEDVGARHEVDVRRRFPDAGALYEAKRRVEARIDPIERDEVVEEIVGEVGPKTPGQRDP